VCNTYFCNATAESGVAGKPGKWEFTVDPCENETRLNPGECHIVSCDGPYWGCKVELNNSVCEEFSKVRCEKWECAPKDKSLDFDESVFDSETGCVLVTNYTEICETALGNRAACTEIVCDPSVVDKEDCTKFEVDTCHGEDNACWTFACTELEDGSYGCVGTPTSHIEDILLGMGV